MLMEFQGGYNKVRYLAMASLGGQRSAEGMHTIALEWEWDFRAMDFHIGLLPE